MHMWVCPSGDIANRRATRRAKFRSSLKQVCQPSSATLRLLVFSSTQYVSHARHATRCPSHMLSPRRKHACHHLSSTDATLNTALTTLNANLLGAEGFLQKLENKRKSRAAAAPAATAGSSKPTLAMPDTVPEKKRKSRPAAAPAATAGSSKKRKAAPNTDTAAAKKPKRKSGKARDAKYLQQASSAVALDPESKEYSAACDAFVSAGLKGLGSKTVLIKLLKSMSRPLPGATQEVLAKRAERDAGLTGTNFEPYAGLGLQRECKVRCGPHLRPTTMHRHQLQPLTCMHAGTGRAHQVVAAPQQRAVRPQGAPGALLILRGCVPSPM